AAPGALPRVLPAAIADDLRRRDFTVNAMAIELASGEFGLIDPLGGRVDLARRRLRTLHPLSYVEDPTRIFRAARYAARLGLSPDRATARAASLALRLAPYPALAGQRSAARLGFSGGPLAVLKRAQATGGALAAELARASAPSARARQLRGRAPLELAGLWLSGGQDLRGALDWFVGIDPRLVSLDGDDVVALGVPRGPAVARVLAEVRDARLDGTLVNRAMEAEDVRQWLARGD